MSLPSRPSTLRLTLILGTLTAIGPLSIDMYLPALPAITREFATSAAATQRTLSIYFIGLAIGQALYGPLTDRFGRKRPLLVGSAIYLFASLACALAGSIESLALLRLVQALGGCAGMVVARAVVRDCFDARDSARVYSFLMLVTGLAPILAPLVGGQLLVLASWRAVFWLLAGFGGLCLALVSTALPETLPPNGRLRVGLGATLATYRRLLADRQFMGYALTGGCIFAGMFTYISGSPFVFIELYGVSPQRYGLIFGANALGLVIASQINRRLLASYPGEAILRAALAVSMAASLALVLAAASGLGGLAGLLVPLFVCIASVGLVSPNTAAAAMAPHGRIAGSASALLGVAQFVVGAGIGVLLGLLEDGSALPMAALIALCGAMALAAFLGLALRLQPQPAQGQP